MATATPSAGDVYVRATQIGYEIVKADRRGDTGEMAHLMRKLKALSLTLEGTAIALIHATLEWATIEGGYTLPGETGCGICDETAAESGAQYDMAEVTWDGTTVKVCSNCVHASPVSITDLHEAVRRAAPKAVPADQSF